MTAVWIVVGMAIFIPLFIALGKLVGWLSDQHRTGIAFLVLAAGLFALLILTASFGHAVR